MTSHIPRILRQKGLPPGPYGQDWSVIHFQNFMMGNLAWPRDSLLTFELWKFFFTFIKVFNYFKTEKAAGKKISSKKMNHINKQTVSHTYRVRNEFMVGALLSHFFSQFDDWLQLIFEWFLTRKNMSTSVASGRIFFFRNVLKTQTCVHDFTDVRKFIMTPWK